MNYDDETMMMVTDEREWTATDAGTGMTPM